MSDHAAPIPKLQFAHDKDAGAFTETAKDYAANHFPPPAPLIGTGALVFNTTASAKSLLLLIQRAASDSMPNKWEVPGGGCDDEDPSILYSVARELWEEAGLEAKHISSPVGEPHFFQTRSRRPVCKLNFLVQAQGSANDGQLDVKLDAKEHQDFVWVTEEEVRAGRKGDLKIDFTDEGLAKTILVAFGKIKEGWPKVDD